MTAEAAVLTCWHRRLFYGIIDPQRGRFERKQGIHSRPLDVL